MAVVVVVVVLVVVLVVVWVVVWVMVIVMVVVIVVVWVVGVGGGGGGGGGGGRRSRRPPLFSPSLQLRLCSGHVCAMFFQSFAFIHVNSFAACVALVASLHCITRPWR